MTERREFTKAVKVQIIKRSMACGEMRCENCGAPVFPGKRFDIDHKTPDALEIDKSRKLTADDGWVLCLGCHSEKTKDDVAVIAEAKRREASHLGARRRPKQPLKSGGTLKGPERAHEGRGPAVGLNEIARRFGIKA